MTKSKGEKTVRRTLPCLLRKVLAMAVKTIVGGILLVLGGIVLLLFCFTFHRICAITDIKVMLGITNMILLWIAINTGMNRA